MQQATKIARAMVTQYGMSEKVLNMKTIITTFVLFFSGYYSQYLPYHNIYFLINF